MTDHINHIVAHVAVLVAVFVVGIWATTKADRTISVPSQDCTVCLNVDGLGSVELHLKDLFLPVDGKWPDGPWVGPLTSRVMTRGMSVRGESLSGRGKWERNRDWPEIWSD